MTAETTDPPLVDPAEVAAAVATGAYLAPWARRTPDVAAVIALSGDRTFGELAANANRLTRALRRRGLRAGDAVAIVCGNRAEFAEAVYACLQGGFRYTPVNWHLSAAEVAYVVDDCDARAVVGDAAVPSSVAAATAGCAAVTTRLAVGGAIDGFDDYDAALAAEDPAPLADPVVGNRMLYTSGTTGRPKGVVRPPGYSTGLAALTSAPGYRAGTGQLNLCTGPLHHGGPLGYSLTAPLGAGVGVVMMERFDAAEALRLIDAHRITHTHMVPTMFHRLLRLPDDVRAAADVDSLTYVLHGGAPCPPATKTAIIDWFGPVVWEYFAATEGAASSIGPEEWLEHPGSVGRPLHPDTVRIIGADGKPCPAGVDGVIHVRRDPAGDFEYFKDPDKTARARHGDYLTVGDVGHLDTDGYLFVTDRGADLIVRGGVNVYPAEVEAVLLEHPRVRDAGVIGVADEEFGEEVKAVVQPDGTVPDHRAFEAELIAWCRDRIAHFKCPRSVDVTDALPRLDNGKLYRERLRDQYRSGGGGTTHA